MRITNKMISDRVLHNLTLSTNRYLQLQNMASSGRRINKPSDDPLGITKDLHFRGRLADIAQYNLNISHSQSWLTFSDQAMGDINDLIIQAKDLATQLGNDTYDGSARMAGATQAREMIEQILDASNTNFQGKYIFSGSRTNIPAIAVNSIGAVYQGDYQDFLMETETNSFLKINSFASEFMTKQVRVIGEGTDLNPGLQPNLWLTELHGGQGVNMGAGQFTINTLNGSFNIDLAGANVKNIQQLLDTINNAVPAPIPNFTASISDGGSGFQLVDTSDHQLTADTPLAMLNNGHGISQSPGTFIIRTSDSSTVLNIDISAATDLNDVITTINAALNIPAFNNGDVTVGIDPDENKLAFNDASGTFDIVIEEAGPNQTTAADLGIAGEFQGSMVGEDLRPLHIQVLESAAGETLAADLGFVGGTEFETMVGDDLDPRLTYHTLVSSLNTNQGIELGVIRITNGFDYIDIDLSSLTDDPNATVLDIVDMINRSAIGCTAYLNSDRTGLMVKSEYDDRSFMITEADAGSTAMNLGIFGSSDLLGNMMILERALERNNVQEINSTLNIFDNSLDQLLTSRSDVGSRSIRADTSQSRMLSQELLMTDQLSKVEDADMLKTISDLTTAEVVYQSALASTARIIQYSLIDFLQ